MDPLSLDASVLVILAANKRFCSELKSSTNPSKEFHDLHVELSELEHVLQTIQTSLFDGLELSHIQLDAVSKALVKTADFLFSPQFRTSIAGENLGGDHSQWIRKKNNIEGLRKQLISIRCELKALVVPQARTFMNPGFQSFVLPRLPRNFQRRTPTPRVLGITRSIRPCYVLIFLGLLTIVGSLVPALWRSISHNDISGGFSLAQYILGVGVFVIGCVVAIHSRTCNCWSSDSGAVSPDHTSSLELEAVHNIPNVQPYELPG